MVAQYRNILIMALQLPDDIYYRSNQLYKTAKPSPWVQFPSSPLKARFRDEKRPKVSAVPIDPWSFFCFSSKVRLRGFLTEPARVFASRSGQPRLCFRLEVRINDERLPPKEPAGVDYFSVVAFGQDFLPLATQLVEDREVLPTGRLRSRDIDTDGRHVVTEIVAREIVPLKTRADAMRGKRLSHATIQ